MEQSQKLAVDTLYKGADILTLDKDKPFIRNGSLAVTGDRIVAIGTSTEVDKLVASSKKIVNVSDLLLMPELVDGHTHLF